jgi:excinuclease ABC subunit C
MKRLFSVPEFHGFGPCSQDLTPRERPCQRVEAKGPAALRKLVRRDCGRQPGVYGMVDGTGRLIYVGKAKVLRTRLLSYFRSKGRDPKAGRILGLTRTILWEPCLHEFSALLRELELIRRWRPHFNAVGKLTRRVPTYICIGRQPAAQLFLSRRPPPGLTAVFGPVFASRRLREAVRRLNDHFLLQDCPTHQEMIFADQRELFPAPRTPGCLRYEIQACLGPCFAACTRAAYREQVRALYAFLAGTDSTVLDRLRSDMTAAAIAQEYERAANLRDRLELFCWLDEKLTALRGARAEQNFIYAAHSESGAQVWFALRHGQVAAVMPAPAVPSEQRKLGQVLRRIYKARESYRANVAAEEIDHVLLVAAWFRRRPAERDKCLVPAALLDRLVDAQALET